MWGDCAARAKHIHEHGRPKRDDESVALAVGNAVHKEITGHTFEEPKRIRFDADTRTTKEMHRQVKAMTKVGADALANHGLTISDRELKFNPVIATIGKTELRVCGTADMICQTKDGKTALIDLKTGAHPPKAAWLQLATYAWIANALDINIDECGILWLPRKRDGGEGKFWSKPANELIPIADTMLKRIASAHAGNAPPNPSSLHCSTCPKSDCAARLQP